MQVMMQSGTVRSFECTSGKCAADEAIFCRATFLPTTSANHLLQGFFGNYPLDLEDEELLGRVSAQCVFLVLPFSHDRAASNYKMLKCLWNLLSRSSVPLNTAPHSEACTLHGFALVKNRPIRWHKSCEGGLLVHEALAQLARSGRLAARVDDDHQGQIGGTTRADAC